MGQKKHTQKTGIFLLAALKKERPRIEKRGNKVTQIRTARGVAFRDITKLLAPSTNLRAFGKLFNLEQAKAHFPFRILTSVGVLNTPQLPVDLSAWKSELTGNSPVTQSEVEEALELFAKAGCQNIGKFTISSLSNYAGLKTSAAAKRIGNFFPNNSQVYRLLRAGMRG